MKRLTLISFILFFASTALGQETSWSKYIPEKQRKPIISECLRNTGLKGVLYDKSAAAMKLIASGPRNCFATSVATDDLVAEILAISVGESA